MDIFERVLYRELVFVDDPDCENVEDAVLRAVRTICDDDSECRCNEAYCDVPERSV